MNSALLSEYTLIDERVTRFLLSIKAWAKLYGVSSAADNRISSYAWVNLGIFYLQCIGFVPNLQCREFMSQHEFELDPDNWSHFVNDLDTGFMPWNIVTEKNVWKQPDEWKDTPVALLMYGFFHFYAKHFPKALFSVSMREGSIKIPKTAFDKARMETLCIEDPFETHCSHTPHDLGRPAGDIGHPVIAKALAESELVLHDVLSGDGGDDEAHIWRLTEVAQTPPESLVNSLHDVMINGGRKKPPKKGQAGGKGGQKKDIKQPKKRNGLKAKGADGAKEEMESPSAKGGRKGQGSRRSKKQSRNAGDHVINGGHVDESKVKDENGTGESGGDKMDNPSAAADDKNRNKKRPPRRRKKQDTKHPVDSCPEKNVSVDRPEGDGVVDNVGPSDKTGPSHTSNDQTTAKKNNSSRGGRPGRGGGPRRGRSGRGRGRGYGRSLRSRGEKNSDKKTATKEDSNDASVKKESQNSLQGTEKRPTRHQEQS